MISVLGDLTLISLLPSGQDIFIDKESFPTGIVTPSLLHILDVIDSAVLKRLY